MQQQQDSLLAFRKLLDQKELKYTHERQCIYEEIQQIHEHFDADSLYQRFKDQGIRLARGTVYRTIPLLLEAGILQKSAGDGKCEFYEKTSTKGHHDHMVCLGCKGIVEFHSEDLEKLQEKLSIKYKFKLVFHDHRLFGYCQNCQS